MVPILYRCDSMGLPDTKIGHLVDCLDCYIDDEVNGKYELTITYPLHGRNADRIKVDTYILAYYSASWAGDKQQFFHVYKIEKRSGGTMTIYAEHMSYILESVLLTLNQSSAAYSAQEFLQGKSTDGETTLFTCLSGSDIFTEFFPTYDKIEDSKIRWNLKSNQTKIAYTFPKSAPYSYMSYLHGQDGSILDKFGGFYVYDNYNIHLVELPISESAMQGRQLVLRLGHNASEMSYDIDVSDVVGTVYGYAYDSDKDVLLVSDAVQVPNISTAFKSPQTAYVDVSEQAQSLLDTVKSLDSTGTYTLSSININKATENYVKARVNDGTYGLMPENIEVTYQALSETEAEDIKIRRPVTVKMSEYGLTMSTYVQSLHYDVLRERVETFQIGKKQRKIADYIKTK